MATPELADKRGKRFIVFQEPEGDDKIYVGVMKELTGSDWIMARPLYKEPFKYKPQFKLLLTCNKLPFIPSTDGGTWRRLRVTPWESEFVDDDPKPPKQFKKNYNLTDDLAKWNQAFMWLLLNKYYPKYKKEGLKEPKKVTLFTDNYKKNSDVYWEFICEFMIVTKNKKENETLSYMYDEFKKWFRAAYSTLACPARKDLQEYLSTKDYCNVEGGIIYGLCFKSSNEKPKEDGNMFDKQ